MAIRRLCICTLLAAPLLWAATPARAGEDADFRRAHHLYTLNEYQMAAEGLAKYLADFPSSERAGQARLLLAESLYQLKDFAKAGQHFEQFLKDFPGSPRRAEALQRAAKVHALSRNHARAIECAELFLKENRPHLGQPDASPALPALFESVLYYAGDSAYALKRPDAARGYWEALRKEFPQSKLVPDAAEGLGWLAFEGGRFEEAAACFALPAATPGHPKAAASQLLLARSWEKQGKLTAAMAALEKVAGLTGGKEQAPAAALQRALFFLHARRYAEALPAFQTLTKDFPGLEDAPAALAEASGQAESDGKSAEAVALATLYLGTYARGPDRAPVARILARALVALKKDTEALAAAQAALREAEALPAGARRDGLERPAALMLLAERSGAEGAKHYEAVVKDHAASRFAAPARYQLAYLAGQANRLDEALAQAEAVLQTLPAGGAEQAELHRKALFAAADFAFRGGRGEAAEKHLRAYVELPAVKADPEKGQVGLARLRLAWCRSNAQDFAAAVRELDAALPLAAPGDLRSEVLYLRGRSHLKLKNVEQGLAGFKALVQAAPDSSFADFACYEAGQTLYEAGKAEEALAWLDPYLKKPAASGSLQADALLLRAKARFKARRYADALVDLEALAKSPALKDRAASAQLLQALCYEEMPGKGKEAEAAYTELIGAGPFGKPESRQGLFRRGLLRFEAKRFGEAKADFSAYLGVVELRSGNGADVEAALRLALCLKELKDAAGARAQLEKLAKLALTGAAAFEVPFQLGHLAYEAGQHAEAIARYRQALDAAARVQDLPKPALAAAWLNLAWSQQRAGDGKQAAASFGELIEFDPEGSFAAEARYQQGRLWAEAGNGDAALGVWKELLARPSTGPFAEKALAATGQTLAQAGRFVEASAAYEQYLAKYPGGAGAREAWCGLAECRLQTKNPAGAREAFLKALGEKGAEAELDEVGERAVLGLAELALAKGEAGESKKLALRVILDRPDSRWLDAALYLCAKASEGLAEPDKAIGYYRKLLAERPLSERAATARERLKALGAPAEKP